MHTEVIHWSRLELRNSLFIIKKIQLALKVSSLRFCFNAPYAAHETFRMKSYPDLDTGASGGTQPVTVGAEAESIDGVTTVQGVKVLALIQVPQHGLPVLHEKRQYASITIFIDIVDF